MNNYCICWFLTHIVKKCTVQEAKTPVKKCDKSLTYRAFKNIFIYLLYTFMYIYLFYYLNITGHFTLRAPVYFTNRTATPKLVANPFSFPVQDSANTALFLR